MKHVKNVTKKKWVHVLAGVTQHRSDPGWSAGRPVSHCDLRQVISSLWASLFVKDDGISLEKLTFKGWGDGSEVRQELLWHGRLATVCMSRSTWPKQGLAFECPYTQHCRCTYPYTDTHNLQKLKLTSDKYFLSADCVLNGVGEESKCEFCPPATRSLGRGDRSWIQRDIMNLCGRLGRDKYTGWRMTSWTNMPFFTGCKNQGRLL